MIEIDASMRSLIDYVVDGVPGVTGALLASADGFVIASRLAPATPLDASAIAAMSAATLGLANRLVGLEGKAAADVSVHRSPEAQVFVFSVTKAAALTVLATRSADAGRILRVGGEVSRGLAPAFTPKPT